MANTQIANITFHGHALVTANIDGNVFVAMKPIVENIGLQWEAQYKRINRHPVLKRSMSMMDIQMPNDDQSRKVTMLPLKMLNGWLFGIESNRVKPECRDAVIKYQEECFDALYSYWNEGAAINPRSPINPAMQSDLQAIVATISPDGKQRGMIWSRFNRHFKVAKYNQLPVSQIEEAKQYLINTFLEGEYMEKDEAEYWKQYADKNAKSLADIKAIMTGNMSRPSIEPSEELKMAIKQKAFTVAHEFYETFVQHLQNSIAHSCEGFCPRVIDENKAMHIVKESSIDTALSHQYYGLLNNLSIMAGNLTTMTNTYQSDINRALGKPERMQLAA